MTSLKFPNSLIKGTEDKAKEQAASRPHRHRLPASLDSARDKPFRKEPKRLFSSSFFKTPPRIRIKALCTTCALLASSQHSRSSLIHIWGNNVPRFFLHRLLDLQSCHTRGSVLRILIGSIGLIIYINPRYKRKAQIHG